MYSLAMSVVKNEFDAEEILQVSFLRAFDKLSTFKGNSKFSTWLYRITINESFKFMAKKKNEFVDFVEEISAHHEIDYSILELEKEDQKNIVNDSLLKLPPKESLMLRLFYLEENSIEEMVNITGWTKANIKVTLHRARLHLKHLLTRVYKINKKELY